MKVEGLAGLDEKFTVHGHSYTDHGKHKWSSSVSWREIFAYVSPYLMKNPADVTVKSKLCDALVKKESVRGQNASIEDQDFQTITIQLKALGLINVSYAKTVAGGMGLFWAFTPPGERLMMQLRTVPSGQKG
jgi:hypothetical protein